MWSGVSWSVVGGCGLARSDTRQMSERDNKLDSAVLNTSAFDTIPIEVDALILFEADNNVDPLEIKVMAFDTSVTAIDVFVPAETDNDIESSAGWRNPRACIMQSTVLRWNLCRCSALDLDGRL